MLGCYVEDDWPGEQLELMTDVDMVQFIEKGMRGGLSYIANRHGTAHNKYMTGCDSNKPSKYIMYLDANTLYGWALSQCLSAGGFKWLTQKQINMLKIQTLTPASKRGMILEVDLEYPDNLHDLHNDYPVAAEKMKVTPDMLSPCCKMIRDKYGISI